jgi:hypothetical protein
VKLFSECFDILLNEGDWSNQGLRELTLTGKNLQFTLVHEKETENIFKSVIKLRNPNTTMVSLDYDKDVEVIRNFIQSNTHVNFLNVFKLNDFDISQEMKYNYHINKYNHADPWVIYYVERNIHYLDMLKKFKAKPILKVKKFDISFHFNLFIPEI